MKQTIRLYEIFDADLCTRAKAGTLSLYIDAKATEVTLDFAGVTFMSRSFADELYNIIDRPKEKTFIYQNRNAVVKAMMNAVSEGRSKQRKRGIQPAEIHQFDDIESLSAFLGTAAG